jgi:hypothetical protein
VLSAQLFHRLKTILLSLLLSCSMTVFGQTYNQSLYWLRYQINFNFSERLSWTNDVDNRRFINPDVENQLIFHSRLHYKTDRWDFASGLTYSIAYAAFPEIGYKNPMSELRPVVEASYEIPVGGSFIAQRIRLDNRIFQEIPEVSLFDESFYVMRLRYRIQARIPLKKNEANVTTIGLRLADEIMVNMKENLYDQNRIYVSGEFYINPSFSLEAGYIYIHQQRFGLEEFFSRNVMRFSVIHRINLAN